ncbi:DinB family protein [Desulfovibrio ferrophilus]|uniref:DinB superfamily n=1 Tax=Desulfovibrio ferrophilus TaxID=241368 RepID=A0A2Z6AZQ7_9BACT|nr:DinB family protein [Desulfovibrio ferrophilus]BBD08732.1 DinB superfamily [Desulfovibrio ferrophilus]
MMNLDEARQTVTAFQELLDSTPVEAAQVRVSPDAWTLTEIVGHLVDSASNNHQRFARLSLGNLEDFPGYDAEPWVEAQHYATFDFKTLATLWSSYNALILHLAANIPESARTNAWIREDGPQTLEFLIEDYYSHLRLHTDHYTERRERWRTKWHHLKYERREGIITPPSEGGSGPPRG